MEKEFENYFGGELSDKEKAAFLDKVESDSAYKSEFIRMQHVVSLSRLYTQQGDDEWAGENLKELGRKIELRQRRQILLRISKYVAVILLLIINGWLLKDKIFTEEDTVYTTIEVPKGQRICMTLTDGTEVWLSPRSVLHIPADFRKKERVVRLDGEGYFSVTKDEKKPFIVQTERHAIKVLGTRFNVFAYSESDRFQLDLLEGKVEVSDLERPEEVFLLTPNEKVVQEGHHLIKSISRFNNEDYLKNGVFSFNNKPFHEILEYLTLWYDVRFEIKETVNKELQVSGKFRQSDEVRNILKALQGVHPFRFKEVDEQRVEIY